VALEDGHVRLDITQRVGRARTRRPTADDTDTMHTERTVSRIKKVSTGTTDTVSSPAPVPAREMPMDDVSRRWPAGAVVAVVLGAVLGAGSVGGVAGATGTADTTATTPTPTPDSDAARAARRDDRVTVSTATGTLLVTGTSNREAETTPSSTPASDGSLLGPGAIVVALLAVGGWLGRR